MPDSFPHGGQAVDELRDGKFELTDEHTARRGDGESAAMRAGRQRQGEIGDQQRLAHFGFSTDKQNPLRRQQSGLHQAGPRSGGLLLQKLGQRQHRSGRGFLAGHSRASVVASSRIGSSTRVALREAARRKAVRASLLTLRRMPLVA